MAIRHTSTGPMRQGSMQSGAVQLELGVRMNNVYRTNDISKKKLVKYDIYLTDFFYDRLPFLTNKMNDLYRTHDIGQKNGQI